MCIEHLLGELHVASLNPQAREEGIRCPIWQQRSPTAGILSNLPEDPPVSKRRSLEQNQAQTGCSEKAGKA